MSNGKIAVLTGLAVLATLAVGLVQGPAASADVLSPAGTVGGGIVIFAPPSNPAPIVAPSIPSIAAPRGGLTVPVPAAPNAPGPAVPNIILVTPTPATGSLVVPLSGPSFTQLHLVIPGPNPAQNTTVGLQQLLTTLLAPAPLSGSSVTSPTSGAPLAPVTVYTAPSR
jgi:hypothetical protein